MISTHADIALASNKIGCETGYRYSIRADIISDFAANSNVLEFEIWDVTGAAFVGYSGFIAPSGAGNFAAGHRPAVYVTPKLSVKNEYEIRVKAITGTATDVYMSVQVNQDSPNDTPPTAP